MINAKNSAFFLVFASIVAACLPLSANSLAEPTTIGPVVDASKTPVIKETPTYNPPPSQIFSMDDVDTILPDDIFEEVSYSTAGGGGGPSECPYYDPSSPTVGFYGYIEKNDNGIQPIKFPVCGWEFDERVEVRVTSPTGKASKEIMTATRPFYSENPDSTLHFAVIDYEYIPVNGEYGKYEFSFSGKSGFLKYFVYFNSPNLGMKYQSDNSGERYYIQGLYPKEEVELIFYKSVGPNDTEYKPGLNTFKFVAFASFISSSNGELVIIINANNESFTYDRVVAMGNLSGNIPNYDGLGGIERIYPSGSCVENPWRNSTIPTRLEVGDFAYISLNSEKSNRLRSGPGKENGMIDKIHPGEVIEVIDGPKCIDGVTWWQVKGKDRVFEGWTSEGEDEYWLVPCSPKNKACP
ncbi:MAG: SH3 domain-containing protein [Anaerolineales bacterium]